MSRLVDHYNNIGKPLVQNNIEYQTSEYLFFLVHLNMLAAKSGEEFLSFVFLSVVLFYGCLFVCVLCFGD